LGDYGKINILLFKPIITMTNTKRISLVFLAFALIFSSCVSKKKYDQLKTETQAEVSLANEQLGKAGAELSKSLAAVETCEKENNRLENELKKLELRLSLQQEQLVDLRQQRDNLQVQITKQMTQVGDLTVLSQSASDNIKETLAQLERKDKYIQLVQAARTKADSINLALAVNLKSVLKDGIEDEDIDIKVDKTLVFINLSDKMLYKSGSADLTPKAMEVLGKIAQIIEGKPEFEIMVEGYTDNVPISNSCTKDNWDLSVRRSTSVVRVLQKDYKVNPNRLIAAGRGEYNALASNDTAAGRATNRRTRIIILPKLDQFYDLLNPANALGPK
jgi:chemotaxis protein MotB